MTVKNKNIPEVLRRNVYLTFAKSPFAHNFSMKTSMRKIRKVYHNVDVGVEALIKNTNGNLHFDGIFFRRLFLFSHREIDTFACFDLPFIR